MTVRRPLVAVVDDDESVRESLPDWLRLLGFEAETFVSAEAFLASPVVDRTDCLLLDIAMPGMSGPDLQQELKRQQRRIPIVFITAHAEDRLRERLATEAAVDCLSKPLDEARLLAALAAALRAAA